MEKCEKEKLLSTTFNTTMFSDAVRRRRPASELSAVDQRWKFQKVAVVQGTSPVVTPTREGSFSKFLRARNESGSDSNPRGKF